MATVDDDMYAIEFIIDARGLAETLTIFAQVMYEKQAHIESAWQDEALGKLWGRIGGQLDRVADEACKLGLMNSAIRKKRAPR